MSEELSGIAGIKALLKKMQDPEEYETGQRAELEHMVNGLAAEVMALGNAVLQAREMKEELEETMEQGWMATAASTAFLRLTGGLPGTEGPGLIAHLEGIGRAMAGKVRIDLGNLDDSPTLREVNARRGHDRQSEPDGPVADSSDGYKIPDEMEEK